MRFPLAALALTVAACPALAMEDFVLADEVEYCMSCHGADGVPIEPEYPVIWGQQYFYIYTQLRDYGAGRRDHEIMTPIAAEYDRDQAKLLAEHFAALAWPDIPSETQEGDEQIAERGVTGGQCSACHGKWQGDSRIPRLAGQQPAYLRQTMLDFKNEVRMNAPDKISTMQQLEDETIEALARYLSTVDVQ
jgi:cytochrome c553